MAIISLFSPSSGDYSTRSAAISRQKKLADALAQIAQQETPVSTVGGITAPISPYSGLVKGLTSFGGSYLARKASEEEAALKKEQGEARAKALESFFEKPEKRGLVTSEAETTRPYQATFQAPTLPGMPAPEAVTAELQMPVSPTTQAGMIPGGPTSYADKVRMAYQFATGDDERLAALAPTLLTAAQPKIESIGARGSIVQDPLTGEMQVVGQPIEKPTDLPASVDEYNFAKTQAGGGFKGSYTDWLKTKTGATTRITVDSGRRDFSVKTGLRKEFNLLPDVKAFNDVATSYDVISDIANKKNPSPQDDLSLIYSFMKMLDPLSVVREGEFATAENSASVPDRIRNVYNKVLTGNRLNSSQRAQYANTAGGVYESRKRRYDEVVDEYSDYARDAGLDPKEVFRARGKAGPASVTEPAAPDSGGWTKLPNGVRIRERK